MMPGEVILRLEVLPVSRLYGLAGQDSVLGGACFSHPALPLMVPLPVWQSCRSWQWTWSCRPGKRRSVARSGMARNHCNPASMAPSATVRAKRCCSAA